MNRWWRAYNEAVDDPKLILLSDKQHRAWFNLCCITSQNGGVLPLPHVIAVKLRINVAKAVAIVAELRGKGFIDSTDDGFLTMHNWKERQFTSDVSTLRVKRFRRKQRNVSDTVSSAVSETAPESETEAEEERDSRTNPPSPSKYSEPNGSAAVAAPQNFDDVDVVNEDPKARLYRIGKTILVSFGVAEKRTGALIGQWLKSRPDPLGVLAAIQFARDQNVAEPVAYVSAIIHGRKNGPGNPAKPTIDDLIARAEARESESGVGAPGHA